MGSSCPHTSPIPLFQGDTRVFLYEVTPEPPYFLECNSFTSSDPHKVRGGPPGPCRLPRSQPAHTFAPPGLRFPAQDSVRRAGGGVRPGAAAGAGQPRAGGFPRASRQGSHRARPRGGQSDGPSSPCCALQKEYFQEDIFPPTRVWWEPALSAGAWLGGAEGQQGRADLRPAGMEPGGCAGPRGRGTSPAVGPARITLPSQSARPRGRHRHGSLSLRPCIWGRRRTSRRRRR